jgi:ankyrin repeat protein
MYKEGFTPLMWQAIQANDARLTADAVAAWREKGFDLNDIVGDGLAPLDLAARKGADKALGILIAAGCELEKAGSNGYTALGRAASHGRSSCVALLLEAGADPRAGSSEGVDAWTQARIQGHVECFAMLTAAVEKKELDAVAKSERAKVYGNGLRI